MATTHEVKRDSDEREREREMVIKKEGGGRVRKKGGGGCRKRNGWWGMGSHDVKTLLLTLVLSLAWPRVRVTILLFPCIYWYFVTHYFDTEVKALKACTKLVTRCFR